MRVVVVALLLLASGMASGFAVLLEKITSDLVAFVLPGFIFGIFFSVSVFRSFSKKLYFSLIAGLIYYFAAILAVYSYPGFPGNYSAIEYALGYLVAGGFGSIALYFTIIPLHRTPPQLLPAVGVLIIGTGGGALFFTLQSVFQDASFAPGLSYTVWQVPVGLALYSTVKFSKPWNLGDSAIKNTISSALDSLDGFIESRIGQLLALLITIIAVISLIIIPILN